MVIFMPAKKEAKAKKARRNSFFSDQLPQEEIPRTHVVGEFLFSKDFAGRAEDAMPQLYHAIFSIISRSDIHTPLPHLSNGCRNFRLGHGYKILKR